MDGGRRERREERKEGLLVIILGFCVIILLFQFFSILIKCGLISFTLTPNIRLDNGRRNLLRYITAERLIKNGEMNDPCTSDASCRTASFACNFEDWLKAFNENATEKDECNVDTHSCVNITRKKACDNYNSAVELLRFFIYSFLRSRDDGMMLRILYNNWFQRTSRQINEHANK